jgi:ribose transport system substrate-binding protein
MKRFHGVRRRRLLGGALAVAALALASNAVAGTTKWPTVDQEAATAGQPKGISFCGTKPITLGIEDAFGVNAWSQNSMAAVRSEAALCPNVKQIVAIGGGDLQKTISDVNGFTAQGVNAIVLIPDFGKAQLPSIQQATAAGAKVVPWGSDPGGQIGKDYTTYVDWIGASTGRAWATWMVEALHGKGNVVMLGGPAGNSATTEFFPQVVAVFKKHPGIKLLTGTSTWEVTNWDPATAQKAMGALLAKYPKIDGVISDYGTDALAAMRAFQAANRTPVPIATLDTNGLACLYQKLHKTDPAFQIATTSGHNWMGRIAARKAIAAAEGLPNQEPSRMALPFYEDTLHGKTATCVAGRSPDAYISNQLSTAQLSKYGKP